MKINITTLSFRIFFYTSFCIIFLFTNCQTQKNSFAQNSFSQKTESKPPFTLHFIGQQIIPFKTEFGENEGKMTVGGLSGIDYDKENDFYYLICDDLFDSNGLLRFYTAKLKYNQKQFEEVTINSVHIFKQENGNFYPKKEEGLKIADPESIVFSSQTNTIFWSSEGDRTRNILPFIAESDTNGNQIRKLSLPAHFIDTTKNRGWFNNAAIESITLAENEEKIWFLSETPLQQDGVMIEKTEGIFPIRLMCLDRKTSVLEQEYIYLAKPVAKEPIPKTAPAMNGVVEILEWKSSKNTNPKNTQFLVLERSFSVGYKGGESNTVRLFLIETENATDSKNIESLKNLVPNKHYIPLKKQLIADLSDLNLDYIDNIEGMTLGKNLENGNKTIIFISDNNFQDIQKTQFLVFEIIE